MADFLKNFRKLISTKETINQDATPVFNERILKEFRYVSDMATSSLISDYQNNFGSRVQFGAGGLIVGDDQIKDFPQLPTNLTTDQINNLFKLLVDGKFIPADTSPDCFKWAFGDLMQSQPDQWNPIAWKCNKQLLRELLTAIKANDIIIADMEKIAPLIFIDEKGIPFKLAKNKNKEDVNHKRLKRILATFING